MPDRRVWSTVAELGEGGTGPTASVAGFEQRTRSTFAKERVTANLTPRSVRALANLARWTGYSKTDTINRALQIYEFLQQIMNNGGSVHVLRSSSGEPERLTFF